MSLPSFRIEGRYVKKGSERKEGKKGREGKGGRKEGSEVK
jgi:hypothetical protein